MSIKVRENGQWVNLPCSGVSDVTQGGVVNLDTTLTKSGYAADAKAVGDKIGNLSDLITEDQSNLVAAINEAANSGGGEAFIVSLDILDTMVASHGPKEIYEAVQEGKTVIGQFKYDSSNIIIKFNLSGVYYNSATDTTNESGSAIFNCHMDDHKKTIVMVNLDKTIEIDDVKYSTIDEITGAKQGQIPVVASVNSSGQITQWDVMDPSNLGGDGVIKIIPKLLYSGSGTLDDINLEDSNTTQFYGGSLSTLPYINVNKDYLIKYNDVEYRVKGCSMGSIGSTYLGNIMVMFEWLFSSLSSDSSTDLSMILPLLLMLLMMESGVYIDVDAYQEIPFAIFPNSNGAMLMVNNGNANYDITITELNVEIEEPVQEYLQADWKQFNRNHPGFIKNKIAGIEPTGAMIFDGKAGDLDISSFTGPDDTTVYEADLGIIGLMQLYLPIIGAIGGDDDDINTGYLIVKMYETYQLLPMVAMIDDEIVFGNLSIVNEDADDTGEDFLITLIATEVDQTVDYSGQAFQALGYTNIQMDSDTPLAVELAIAKTISKTFLPSISESDIPSTIVNYKNSYPHFILRDSENNYEYVVISRNGNLISYCRCKSITVTTPPTKTAYTSGETFDPTGMVVTITRQDGTTEETTNYKYSTSTLTNTNQTSMSINYTEAGRTYYTSTPITVTA